MTFLSAGPKAREFIHAANETIQIVPAVLKVAPVLAGLAVLQGCNSTGGGVPGAVGHGIPGFPGYSETVNPPDARITGTLPGRSATVDATTTDTQCRQAAAQPPVSVDNSVEQASAQGSMTGAMLNDGSETGNMVDAGANIDATTIRIQSFERNERAAQDRFRTVYIQCASQAGYAATAQFQGPPQFPTAPRITVGVPVVTQSSVTQNQDGTYTVKQNVTIQRVAPGVVTPGAPGAP